MNTNRYWKEPYFKAIAAIKEVADKNGLTLTEIALRWISHHSLLKREYGDAVLIGASSLKHIEEVRVCKQEKQGLSCSYKNDFIQNLVDLEKGPLRMCFCDFTLLLRSDDLLDFEADEVLKALDEAWFDVQPYASKYYH